MRLDLMHILEHAHPTILFVTHSLREAVFLSEEVYMMSVKPARIFKHLRVDIPRPREPEDPRLFDLEKGLVKEFFAVLERDQT
jgi:ABC-type nitrate/sulfonate/bicarbonate transport system ATPase subunit